MVINVVLGAGAAAALACLHVSPHAQRLLGEHRLQRQCREARCLVLTYDDGPGNELTPRLLDLLGAHDCKATFFLLGRRAAQSPMVAARIAAQGHEVGCHSQDHLHAWWTWPWKAVEDIARGYETLSPWARRAAIFRPPFGKLSAATWWALRRRGAPLGWWTVDSRDTRPVLPEPQSIVEAVLQAGGGVVLFHDFDRGPERSEFVLRSTDLLLRAAKKEGLSVRQLGDLLARRRRAPELSPRK